MSILIAWTHVFVIDWEQSMQLSIPKHFFVMFVQKIEGIECTSIEDFGSWSAIEQQLTNQ